MTRSSSCATRKASELRALLDINVLIALLDAQHVHHHVAARWLQDNIDQGWASCPLTQNGVIRIMSQPAYPNPLAVASVARRLAEAAAAPWHRFWPDSTSLLEDGSVHWPRVLGSRQITDVYLLTLALRNDGRFASFDRRIDPGAVPGAGPQHLVVLD